jgi:hypothetical protein
MSKTELPYRFLYSALSSEILGMGKTCICAEPATVEGESDHPQRPKRTDPERLQRDAMVRPDVLSRPTERPRTPRAQYPEAEICSVFQVQYTEKAAHTYLPPLPRLSSFQTLSTSVTKNPRFPNYTNNYVKTKRK